MLPAEWEGTVESREYLQVERKGQKGSQVQVARGGGESGSLIGERGGFGNICDLVRKV